MSERVTMPALGESVTEGTVTQWLKSVGDSVEVDEPLLEVSTDKVDTEIPSPVAGVLQEILVEEDETVEVGADLAVIGDGDGDSSDDSAEDEDDSDDEGDTEDKKESEGAQSESEESAEETPDAPSADASADGEQEKPKKKKSSGGGGGGGETVKMPELGESVTEGTVTQWLKAEGDDVEVDEPLLEVSTDKVDTEIPSPFAGKLTKILVQEDDTISVGGDLAIIGGDGGDDSADDSDEADEADEDESQPEEEKKQESSEKGKDDEAEAKKAEKAEKKADAEDEKKDSSEEKSEKKSSESKDEETQPSKAEEADASSYVTPLVRKLAADHDVDLSTLKGTGVGGRIRKQDVLDAARAAEEAKEKSKASTGEAPPSTTSSSAPSAASSGGAKSSAPKPQSSEKRGTTEKMSRLRKVIAERMVDSLKVSAQLTAVVEVDMSRVAALRAKSKSSFEQREGVKLSYLPFIALATVETLKAFPTLNSSVDGDQVVFHGAEHLGIAVDTERGLLVPVIKDAGDLNIAGIARKVADLAERTRTNKVTPDELGGGTFTISNIGSNGSILDTPIINQPQVGILGTGAIVKRPVVVQDEYGNDSIAIRHMQYLVLTYDHRVVDGADAGRFLSALKARLEEGQFEV
ncbi:MAG: 2-oxoglutarate dehydrogenase, E2 component, dihydrolipoamide succinyltransferase [Mobilicoccus sp.]|nr:2-oxoglutarate dehydrogenase, E2 component, dihydrolipoamide succinyltransferase [Mobilicoccus sp.]